MKNKRIIITGGGGSGKTSIINTLGKKGFSTYPEVSRQIIKKQQLINGDLTPWQNLSCFAEECLCRMEKQLDNNLNEFSFYDRGIPDIIAYLKVNKFEVKDKYFAKANQYYNTVFICPPWKDIFINDAQRPETFEYSKSIYLSIKKIYSDLGFKLIELPKISVKLRVKIIENYIKLHSNNLIFQNNNHYTVTENSFPSVAK